MNRHLMRFLRVFLGAFIVPFFLVGSCFFWLYEEIRMFKSGLEGAE